VTLGSEREISRLRFCFDGLTVESGSDPPCEPGAEPWQFITTDEALMRRIGEALADFIPLPERWTGQFLALHGALTGDAAMPVSIDDARRSIELVAAAYASSHSAMPIAFPIGRDNPFYEGWRPVAGKTTGPA